MNKAALDQMTMFTDEEKRLILMIREAPAYADFTIMKRPTRECPHGDIIRVTKQTAVEFKNATGHLSTAHVKS